MTDPTDPAHIAQTMENFRRMCSIGSIVLPILATAIMFKKSWAIDVMRWLFRFSTINGARLQCWAYLIGFGLWRGESEVIVWLDGRIAMVAAGKGHGLDSLMDTLRYIRMGMQVPRPVTISKVFWMNRVRINASTINCAYNGWNVYFRNNVHEFVEAEPECSTRHPDAGPGEEE